MKIKGIADRKPYRIAEVCYRPWDEFPWHVVRVGSVAEQGGLRFGVEGVGFTSLEDALDYIKHATERDLPIIDDIIKEKDKWKEDE